MVAITGAFIGKDGKSYPTLMLKAKPEDKYGFTFGTAKARLILENLDAIRAFAGEKK